MKLVGRRCRHARVCKDRNVREEKKRRRHGVPIDTETPQHPLVKEATVRLHELGHGRVKLAGRFAHGEALLEAAQCFVEPRRDRRDLRLTRAEGIGGAGKNVATPDPNYAPQQVLLCKE